MNAYDVAVDINSPDGLPMTVLGAEIDILLADPVVLDAVEYGLEVHRRLPSLDIYSLYRYAGELVESEHHDCNTVMTFTGHPAMHNYEPDVRTLERAVMDHDEKIPAVSLFVMSESRDSVPPNVILQLSYAIRQPHGEAAIDGAYSYPASLVPMPSPWKVENLRTVTVMWTMALLYHNLGRDFTERVLYKYKESLL